MIQCSTTSRCQGQTSALQRSLRRPDSSTSLLPADTRRRFNYTLTTHHSGNITINHQSVVFGAEDAPEAILDVQVVTTGLLREDLAS